MSSLRYCTVTFALLCSSIVDAWTSNSLGVDLAWPPVTHEGYITLSGQRISAGADAAAFPCANVTPTVAPPSRVEFPLSGGRLQFNLWNTSAATEGWNFVVDAYLGQFSNDVNPKKTGWTYLDTYVYEDFTSGPSCTDAINVTDEISTTPAVNLQLASTGNDLVGVYVTLGLRLTLFNPGDEPYTSGTNQEEMYQCAYLELVGNTAVVTEDRGICNVNPYATNPTAPASSTAVSTPTSTASTPSVTAEPNPTTNANPTNGVSAASSSSLSHAGTIGVAIGTAMGLAFLLVALGMFLLRRRKTKKPKPTIALGFWTAGRDEGFRSEQANKNYIESKERELNDSSSDFGESAVSSPSQVHRKW